MLLYIVVDGGKITRRTLTGKRNTNRSLYLTMTTLRPKIEKQSGLGVCGAPSP
jgi:hypothetical protein